MSAKHNHLYDISNDEVSEGEDEEDDREEEKIRKMIERRRRIRKK